MKTKLELTVRRMVPEDASVMASAFAAMGWTSKTIELFARYFQEQAEGLRHVLVAPAAGEFAGYVTIAWYPEYEPLARAGVPELEDLNVLPGFRRQGIATRLVATAEEVVSPRSRQVGIAVGLHPGYNAAQRMYVLRGYEPDGNGVTVGGAFVREGQTVTMDDRVLLHLLKDLPDGAG
jgi:GNAT superfamily N-acetyltransferase